MKYAIQIASVIDDYHDTLLEATRDLINTTDVQINAFDIEDQIEQHEQAARLFFDYGNKDPQKIQKPIFVKKMMAEIWFLSYIGQNYQNLSLIQLKKLIYQKYNQEKELDSRLTEKQYSLISWYLPKLNKNGVLEECGILLQKLSYTVEKAYVNLSIYFEKIGCADFVDKIYVKEMLLPKTIDEDEITTNVEPVYYQSLSNDEDTEKLKNEIKYLEGTIHDLKISKDYAQKDATRNLLTYLNDEVYGYPLAKLYTYMNDSSTSDEMRACLENFFSSLKNAGIRTVKANMIGEEIIITNENKRKFDSSKKEEINIGDTVIVRYPGFQGNGETMIKPIVTKKEN